MNHKLDRVITRAYTCFMISALVPIIIMVLVLLDKLFEYNNPGDGGTFAMLMAITIILPLILIEISFMLLGFIYSFQAMEKWLGLISLVGVINIMTMCIVWNGSTDKSILTLICVQIFYVLLVFILGSKWFRRHRGEGR